MKTYNGFMENKECQECLFYFHIRPPGGMYKPDRFSCKTTGKPILECGSIPDDCPLPDVQEHVDRIPFPDVNMSEGRGGDQFTLDDIVLKVFADTSGVLDNAVILGWMVKNIRRGKYYNLDDLEPYGLGIYCEMAEILLEHIIDHLYECGVEDPEMERLQKLRNRNRR